MTEQARSELDAWARAEGIEVRQPDRQAWEGEDAATSLTTPKSRRSSRAVPLADVLAAELDRHFQRSRFAGNDDLVFAHPQLGTVLDGSKLRRRFTAARDRAGVREIRFHDLRRTFGTRMAAAGAPMRSLQEWLGHSDFRTTLIYAQYAPDQTHGARYAATAFASTPEMRAARGPDAALQH